jgi:hypothetical protein
LDLRGGRSLLRLRALGRCAPRVVDALLLDTLFVLADQALELDLLQTDQWLLLHQDAHHPLLAVHLHELLVGSW